MSDLSGLQQAIQQLEEIGVAGASPFVRSAGGQKLEQRVIAEVNLGVAALPLFASLFTTIAGLFHHAHKAAVASAGIQQTAAQAPQAAAPASATGAGAINPPVAQQVSPLPPQ